VDGNGRVITPSQTVGPFFSFCLTRHPAHLSLLGGPRLATDAVPGTRIVIGGAIHDGLGAPVPDAMIEVWQADSQGRYAGASDASSGFRGFGRVECDAAGRFAIETIKPGPVRAPGGGVRRRTSRSGSSPRASIVDSIHACISATSAPTTPIPCCFPCRPRDEIP
jgi:protocatechuate 3,4-dioxygenase beta subunit